MAEMRTTAGTLNEVTDSILADERDLMNPESFMIITSNFSLLSRRSAIIDRVITQIEAGIKFYGKMDPEFSRDQYTILQKRREELIVDNPAYHIRSNGQTERTKPCSYKARGGVLGIADC